MSSEMITPPTGTYPEFEPLAKVTRSGRTSKWSNANHLPVRPNPAMTSSRISMIPYSSHSARTPSR